MDKESNLIWEAYSQRPSQQSTIDDILDILNDNEGRWDLDDTYINVAKELSKFLHTQDDLMAMKDAVKMYNQHAEPLKDIDASYLWELITGSGYRDEHDGYEENNESNPLLDSITTKLDRLRELLPNEASLIDALHNDIQEIIP